MNSCYFLIFSEFNFLKLLIFSILCNSPGRWISDKLLVTFFTKLGSFSFIIGLSSISSFGLIFLVVLNATFTNEGLIIRDLDNFFLYSARFSSFSWSYLKFGTEKDLEWFSNLFWWIKLWFFSKVVYLVSEKVFFRFLYILGGFTFFSHHFILSSICFLRVISDFSKIS